MIGGTLEGQNQRSLELIEHLIKTGQLTLHGLLYLLHDTQSGTELAKIAELSSKRPLTIQASLADRDVELKDPEWVSLSDKKPDVLEVRVKLSDGSEVNCWAQSDGGFYWKGGGSEVFICEHTVTHWMPQPPKEKDDE